MHPAQIAASLKIAGYTQKDLAEELGVAPTTIGAVLHGRSRSAPIEQRIAEITGHTLEELWPAWYGKPPLVLSDDERALILLCRALPPGLREQVLPTVRAMARDAPDYKAAVSVRGGIRSAGRDYHEGDSGGRKRR